MRRATQIKTAGRPATPLPADPEPTPGVGPHVRPRYGADSQRRSSATSSTWGLGPFVRARTSCHSAAHAYRTKIRRPDSASQRRTLVANSSCSKT